MENITFTKHEYTRLREVVSTLSISQFNHQEEYAAVISEIFSVFVKTTDEGEFPGDA